MKQERHSCLHRLLCASVTMLAVALPYSLQVRASQSARDSRLIPVVRKRAEITEKTAAANQQLIVHLNGMRTKDVINLRPGDAAKVEVAAGTAQVLQGPRIASAASVVSPGQPLPNTALNVAANKVSFVRPEGLEDAVFLDIQIPSHQQVKIIIDRQVLLSGMLNQPLLYHNQQWEQGVKAAPGAYVHATGIAEAAVYGEQVKYDSNTGRYYVPSAKLQILKRKPLTITNTNALAAMLQINETGQVENVMFFTNTPPAGAEQEILKWRFAPFTVEGRAVPVMTILWLKTP